MSETWQIAEPRRQSGLTYRYNTGIIVCHDIRHAVKLIKSNPLGFVLPPPQGGEADEEDMDDPVAKVSL